MAMTAFLQASPLPCFDRDTKAGHWRLLVVRTTASGEGELCLLMDSTLAPGCSAEAIPNTPTVTMATSPPHCSDGDGADAPADACSQ